jgi:hypothetical protein
MYVEVCLKNKITSRPIINRGQSWGFYYSVELRVGTTVAK